MFFTIFSIRIASWALLVLLWPLHSPINSLPCNDPEQQTRIAAALERIARSVDPCGESPQVVQLIKQVRSCRRATYHICTNLNADRNWLDRPASAKQLRPRTINWNPLLQNELEPDCAGDPTKVVVRDPTASLLHELAHAAQDCDGLNPTDYEFQAVRIENIYRRAAGLCQRTKYGTDPLPDGLLKSCLPGHCLCTAPGHLRNLHVVTAPAGSLAVPGHIAGDAASRMRDKLR